MEPLTTAEPSSSKSNNAPKKRSRYRRFLRIMIPVLAISLIVLIYFKYFFVFGDGVKSGHLNYAVKKGNLFKTYEGKLIQEGYKGNLQSNEFEFSIKSKRIYDILSMNSGKKFDLHYKEYHGALPWRGNTRFIVDSIIAMHE